MHKTSEFKVIPATNVSVQKILCLKCYTRKLLDEATTELNKSNKNFRRSIFWSSVVAAVLFLIFLSSGIKEQRVGDGIITSIILGYLAFAFTSQMFWDNLVFDCMFFIIRSFRLPGLIFTLDIEGIIWYITVKLTLSVLAFLLSLAFFVLGVVVTVVFAGFYFPFGLIGIRMENNKLKKKSDAISSEYHAMQNEV